MPTKIKICHMHCKGVKSSIKLCTVYIKKGRLWVNTASLRGAVAAEKVYKSVYIQKFRSSTRVYISFSFFSARRILSLIIAINSLFVGLPRILFMV